MYPEHNQLDPDNPDCREESDTPDPDSEYGWEKLFSERVSTLATIVITILPFALLVITTSSVQKEPGTVEEKSFLQSAVRSATSQRSVEPIKVWGDGLQTRSFLFIDMNDY